jgi:hypothetical protein
MKLNITGEKILSPGELNWVSLYVFTDALAVSTSKYYNTVI